MAELLKNPLFRATNSNNVIQNGAYLRFYLTGTTTPAVVYSNATLTTPVTQPVRTNSAGLPSVSGVAVDLYLDPTVIYKLVISDASDSVIKTIDPVNSVLGAGDFTFLQLGTGAESRTLADKLQKDLPITPFDFGAVGDKDTDDTAALAAMATYVNGLYDGTTDGLPNGRKPVVVFPPCAGFRTTASLAIRSGVSVRMESPLWVEADDNDPIVGLDYTNPHSGTYNAPRGTISWFDVRRITQSDWSSDNDIGVRIPGSYNGHVHIQRADGFTCPFDVNMGYGELSLGEIRDGKYGIVRSVATQFTNQLHVYGGAFSRAGGVNVGDDGYGIKVIAAADGVNTISFEGQSYELNNAVASPGESIPIVLDGSTGPISGIRFINQRAELCGPTLVRATGSVSDVEVGFLIGDVELIAPESQWLDDDGTKTAGVKVYRQGGPKDFGKWRTVFESGPIARKALKHGSAFTIQNMEAANDVGAAPATQTFLPSGTGGAFALTAAGIATMGGSGVFHGVRIKMNGARQLAISGIKPASTEVNVYLIMFDSAGAQITGANKAYGYQDHAYSYSSGAYGGFHSQGVAGSSFTSTEFNDIISFAPSAAVDTVFIMATPVRSFRILATDDKPEWFSATSHLKDQFVAEAIPVALTNVTYPTGMYVHNIAPAAGEPEGWRYDGSNWKTVGGMISANAYTPTNVTTDRAFDADTVVVAELADVVGTLIADLKASGLLA